MHFLNPFTTEIDKISEIFETISSKNAIALLGAGASIANKKFLSKDLIDAYELKISKNFETNDIIKFVDILETTTGLHRIDFDLFVIEQLSKLSPNDAHKTFSSIPWKLIFTTNYDTLIEDAFRDNEQNKVTNYKLRTIRNKKQLDLLNADDEIKYIKLNGCKTDLKEYPLVFSTDNFNRQKSYYEKALAPLKGLSPNIKFISFGYSFTDMFAEKLIETMDKTNFRQKKPLYCVDPFLNENRLEHLTSQHIIGIKCTFEDFFVEYEKWFEKSNKSYLKNLQKFTNNDDSNISVDTRTRLFLNNNILQLKEDFHSSQKINKKEFYIGNEPNYQVITEDFDVVRKQKIEDFLYCMNKSFTNSDGSLIPNLLLLDGDFGTGKTTFIYRAIREFILQNRNTLAFEILKPNELRNRGLIEIIEKSTCNQFIFYCDHIENDSTFKAFNELRVEVATSQYSTIKILFISSIRENILGKYEHNKKMQIKNLVKFHYEPKYSREELGILVENLKEVRLINYRDINEKQLIINEMLTKYNGDSFIMLLQSVENGKHIDYLINAYEELSSEMKEAFKITALVHRFGMKCPMELVKNSIKDFNWTDFIENVIKGNGKGILLQVKNLSMSDQPDLLFVTKHPVIAEALVKKVMTNSDKNSAYKKIFQNISYSNYNASFLVDLLKNIRNIDDDITEGQRENFYLLAKKEFTNSVHFILSYVSFIESKNNSIEKLEDCLRDLEILEADSIKRNHRIVHRKGCLNFKIATLYKKDFANINIINKYLVTAEDWFDIKKQIDPTSDYSYLDYFKLLLWEYTNMNRTDDRKLQIITTALNMYDEAKRIVVLNSFKIEEAFEAFKGHINKDNDSDYLEFLLDKYQDVNYRTKTCILLYYYYENIGDSDKCLEFINELKNYIDDKNVVSFLFKYYGRNLHIADNRIRFFELTRQNEFLERTSPLRFYYYSYIAEFYNYSFKEGKALLYDLYKTRQIKFNPDFHLYWLDLNGDKVLFEAEIVKEKKLIKVRINKLHKTINLIKGDYPNIKDSQDVSVVIRFMFDGLQAEII